MGLTLLLLLLTAIACGALALVPGRSALARPVAVGGTILALAASLWQYGLDGGGVLATTVNWPAQLSWLNELAYRSDTLSASLGAWCLLLGALCLLTIGGKGDSPWLPAIGVLTVGTLYSLVHTWSLLAIAVHLLFLAVLAWAASAQETTESDRQASSRQLAAMGLGSMSLAGMALLVGRTTGGVYDLAQLSLSSLTVWPLILLAVFVVLWLGVAPFTGWSAHAEGRYGALVQAVVLGVPAVTILLRLQAVLTAQGLAGSVPAAWQTLTATLAVLGAITTLVGAAGTVVWAGFPRWRALLTAQVLGLALWALSLDNPAGRSAALAILLAFGVARVAMELASPGIAGWVRAGRAVAVCSLVAMPLTSGFIGAWLLGAALADTRHPALVVLMAGAIMLAAAGTLLHFAALGSRDEQVDRYGVWAGWIGAALAVVLLAGGILPGPWLPRVSAIAGIAGGAAPTTGLWTGLQSGNIGLPVLMLAAGAVVLAAILWLVTAWARSGITPSGALLPTGLDRLQKAQTAAGRESGPEVLDPLLSNPPAAIWWLSLAWLDRGVWGLGALLARLGVGAGGLLSRLEGRFYLPLALILALLILLVVAR